MTLALAFITIALAGNKNTEYQVLHVAGEPGWEIATLCQYPVTTPMSPTDSAMIYDYTAAIQDEIACDRPRVAVYPTTSPRPVISWTDYNVSVCLALGLSETKEDAEVNCQATYVELYPMMVDFAQADPDANGLRTVTVPHGTITLHPSVTLRELRRVVKSGAMQLGWWLDLGANYSLFMGAPNFKNTPSPEN